MNKGYEHSLLQVAEDLANLTPVRLDVLLALAPISPNAEVDNKNPLSEEEVAKKKKAKLKKQVLSEEEKAQVVPEIPTYPEEEEDDIAEAEPVEESSEYFDADSEILPSETDTTFYEQDKQNYLVPESAAKRAASASFDQSMTKVSSQVVRKKKPRKVSDKTVGDHAEDKQSSSGYASNATPTSISSKDESGSKQSDLASETASISSVPVDSSSKDDTHSVSSQISSIPPHSIQLDSSLTPCQTPSSASIETITAPDTDKSPTLTPTPTLVEEPLNLPANEEAIEKVDATYKSESLDLSGAGKMKIDNLVKSEPEQSKVNEGRTSGETKLTEKSGESQDGGKIESKIVDDSKDSPTASESGSAPQTPDESKNKPYLQHRASIDRKVGKISYPKFLENSSSSSSPSAEKKPVPSYGKIADAKRQMFERRQSSLDKDKERVIPMLKVSDAKRAFERRASMPCNQPFVKATRKASLVTQSSLDSRLDDRRKDGSSSPAKRDAPASDLKTKKSPSAEKGSSTAAKRPSPAREKSKSKSPEKQVTERPSVSVKAKSPVKKTSPEKGERVSPQKVNEDEEEKKKKAKETIKKNIAKIKLQELRQSSIESNDSASTPESKRQTSHIVEVKPQSYAKKPTGFVRQDVSVTPTRKVPEIGVSPKPKLKLDTASAAQLNNNKMINESALREQTAAIKEIEPEISQPCTPGQTPFKAAPITRSYKKVTFTKDGACITETGKIISEEGADGSFTRLEKKSKVTHYPSGQSTSASRSESSEETTRTVRTYRGSRSGSIDEAFRSGSISPPMSGGLKQSDSGSSSGSNDIFEDIFDTWSGDPIFNNLSGRMRSMLANRSPFTTLWGTCKKRSKKKSRADSCERKPVTESFTSLRRTGHGTDQEYSDTDTDTEPTGHIPSGGLWKFLTGTRGSESIFDRHRSLFSRRFGNDDFFTDNDPFSSSFTRSMSRDRTASSSYIASKTSTPIVRMVINPISSTHNRTSGSNLGPTKQESLDSNDSTGNGGGTHAGHEYHQPIVQEDDTAASKSMRSYSRTISRENEIRHREESNRCEVDENPSPRRRVEQWLNMSTDLDPNHPISMYTTLRPRAFDRYARSVSSRYGQSEAIVESPKPSTTHLRSSEVSTSSLSHSSSHEIHLRESDSSRGEFIIPIARSESGRKPTISMKVSFSRPGYTVTTNDSGEIRRTYSNEHFSSTTATSASNTPTVGSEIPPDWSSPVVLPESSSLLEQLRTHGYRNLVTQRLSGSVGGSSDIRYDNRESSSSCRQQDVPSNRGKSLTGDSSSIRSTSSLIENGAWKCVSINDQNNGDSETSVTCQDRCMIDNTNQSVIETKENNVKHSSSTLGSCSILSSDPLCSNGKSYDGKYTSLDRYSFLNRANSICPKEMVSSYSSSSSSLVNTCGKVLHTPPIPSVIKPITSSFPSSSLPPSSSISVKKSSISSNITDNVNVSAIAPVNVASENDNSTSNNVDHTESNSKSNSTHRALNSDEFLPPHKETLQERILRKSYYTRFNYPNELRRSSSLRRRSSISSSDARIWDSIYNSDTDRSNYITTLRSSDHDQNARNYLHKASSLFDQTHLKPPLSLSNDKFFERVQLRAQKLIEEARERHARVNSRLNDYNRQSSTSHYGSSHYDAYSDSEDSRSLRRASSYDGFRFSRSGSQTPTYSDFNDFTSSGTSRTEKSRDDEGERKDDSSSVQVVTKAIELLKERVLNEP